MVLTRNSNSFLSRGQDRRKREEEGSDVEQGKMTGVLCMCILCYLIQSDVGCLLGRWAGG